MHTHGHKHFVDLFLHNLSDWTAKIDNSAIFALNLCNVNNKIANIMAEDSLCKQANIHKDNTWSNFKCQTQYLSKNVFALGK